MNPYIQRSTPKKDQCEEKMRYTASAVVLCMQICRGMPQNIRRKRYFTMYDIYRNKKVKFTTHLPRS